MLFSVMDSTLYDQLLPHRGLFHPGTLACGVTVGQSSLPSKRPMNMASRQTPIYDISLSDDSCSPKWRRLATDDRCRPGGGDVTLGLMTSPEVDDFLFHTPPPSDVSSDDASSALPFGACDDDDNVLVGLLDNAAATAHHDSEILFAGAVTAEHARRRFAGGVVCERSGGLEPPVRRGGQLSHAGAGAVPVRRLNAPGRKRHRTLRLQCRARDRDGRGQTRVVESAGD